VTRTEFTEAVCGLLTDAQPRQIRDRHGQVKDEQAKKRERAGRGEGRLTLLDEPELENHRTS
jgi:hypothetical protein